MRSLTILCVCLALFCVACSDDTSKTDSGPPDMTLADQAQPDGPVADQAQPDTMAPDTMTPDTMAPDAMTPDTMTPDAMTPDAMTPDTMAPDTMTPDTTVAPDAMAPDTTVAADMGGLCNNLVNTAAVIQEQAASGAPPTLAGGTIVEGTYHRTQTLYYSSPKSRYIKETIKLTKTAASVYKMEFVSATGTTNPPSPEYHVNVELTLTGGANVTYTIVCGTTGSLPTTYEASSTTFRLRLGPADLFYTLAP